MTKKTGSNGKVGAPKGNKNALRNGSRVDRKRLTVGELPKTMIAIKREGRAYRREIESVVREAKGKINTIDSHYIDTAAAATIQAGICRWLLRNKLEEMSVNDIRGCTADIVRAKERRDAAIRALNIDAPEPPVSLKEYVEAGKGNDKS